jgi:hypothetical protein
MAIKKTSWLTIFGVSLIPTVFFFIQEIPSKEIHIDSIYFGLTPYFQSLLNATIFLLLITFLIASLALKTTETKQKLIRLGVVAFIAWVSSLAIKTLLIISNYPWDSLILLTFFKDPSYIFKAIWLLIPFFIVFILLITLKDKLDNLARFLGALGIAFLLIVSYRLVDSNEAFHIATWKSDVKYAPTQANARKVIWIVFDEFDPEVAFSKKNLDDLPNFKFLMDGAVNHSKMYAPSNATIISIPSMLMGVPTYGNNYKGVGILDVKTSEKTLLPFNYKNTIFQRLAEGKFNASILGYYHPYCELFQQTKCQAFPMFQDFKWYSGIVNAYASRGALKLFDKLFNVHYVSSSSVDSMAYITEKQLSLLSGFVLDENVDFSFIHLNVPHLPSNYAQEFFNVTSSSQFSNNLVNYKLNLRLADHSLGLILRDIDQIKDKKVLLILSSDHWFRAKDEGKVVSSPALFIAKINEDNQKISLTKSTSSIYIEEMVNKFLNNEISSHGDIQNYLSDKSFHKTYLGAGVVQSD